MKTFKMTAGTYYISDACISWDGYYDNFLLAHEWERMGSMIGSTFIRTTGADGGGFIYDMDNQVVGSWGSDAGNVAVVPAKVVGRKVPAHYGMKVTFEDDFDVVCYHDSIVVGGRFRVRHWSVF